MKAPHHWRVNSGPFLLFVGNQDNLGYLFCRHAIGKGFRVLLSMRKRGINRSDPDTLLPGAYQDSADWIYTGSELYTQHLRLCASLPQPFLFSSGIEIQDLLRIENTSARFCILPTGSDLSMWPFVDERTALLPNYLFYRKIIYKHRFKISRIYSSQNDAYYAAKSLGIGDRLFRSYRHPVQQVFIDRVRPAVLDPNYDTIVFMPARKNGDPKLTNYKGAEKLVPAIEHFLSSSSSQDLHINRILFLAAAHSNTGISYCHHHFIAELKHLKSKYPDLRFALTGNLPNYKYWSILKDPRVVVLDQFGSYHGTFGGCSREAIFSGRLLITSSVHPSDYSAFMAGGGCAPYFLFADTIVQISHALGQAIRKQQASGSLRFNSDWADANLTEDACYQHIYSTLPA